jgi:hypothetical protein
MDEKVGPRICGWVLPESPVYVCIENEHDETVPHQPVWLPRKTRAALDALRHSGRTVHGA